MNTSGFTFIPIDFILKNGIPGLLFGFSNNYGIRVFPDSYSEDNRFEHATVTVDVFKGKTVNDIEYKTITIMEKMEHRPTILDMKSNAFTKVSPEYLLKILQTVSQMEIQ